MLSPLERWRKILLQSAILPLFSNRCGIGIPLPLPRLESTLLKSSAPPPTSSGCGLRLSILVFTLQ